MTERSHRLTAADGVELHAWLASPPDPLAILMLCHGLTTNADEHGAFRALRDHALKAGLAVARFDFRAHGRSQGQNQELRLAGERLDVEAVLGLIDRELPSELPFISLGVSFGGAAAVHAAAVRPTCAGIVLWYAVIDYQANFGPTSDVPFTRQCREAADPAHDPDWAEMPVVGTEWFFPRELMAEMAADDTFERLRTLPAPVLIYWGTRDRFVGLEPLRRLASTRRDVDLRLARGAGHGFLLWRPWAVRRTIAWSARAASSYAVSPPSTTST